MKYSITVWVGVCLVSAIYSGQAEPVPSLSSGPQPQEVVKTASDPLLDAHFSLAMQGAPLPRMLALLERTTGLHFRYGAPLDSVVYTSFNNAPLLPTLNTLLCNEGFQMQRQGYEIFIFRAPEVQLYKKELTPYTKSGAGKQQTEPSGNLAKPAIQPSFEVAQLQAPQLQAPLHRDGPQPNTPVAWSYWAGSTPPPPDWLVGQAPAKEGTPAGTQRGWRLATLHVDSARRPGVAVSCVLPGNGLADKGKAGAPFWLRWPINLRQVPEGAQLLLDSPAEATFYINGAPLLRHWQGTHLFDLSHVLHAGLNHLAIYWPHAPITKNATGPIGTLLNYEWFFDTAPTNRPPARQNASPGHSGTDKGKTDDSPF